MFEAALMESSNSIKTKSKYWSFLATVMNCGILIALIIRPLPHTDALPTQIIAPLLVAPPPPQASQPRSQVQPELLEKQIQAPSKIPKDIKTAKESASLQPSPGGVIDMGGRADGTADSAIIR
jgi:hypothetical protein